MKWWMTKDKQEVWSFPEQNILALKLEGIKNSTIAPYYLSTPLLTESLVNKTSTLALNPQLVKWLS